MHAHQPTILGCGAERSKDAGIVEHENAGIGHEELETRHAIAHQSVHLLQLRGPEVGDDAMKRVIADCPAGRLLHPSIKGSSQRLASVLDGEIDERSRAPKRRRARAGFEIVGAGRAAEGHVEMSVHVDAARENVPVGGVDDLLRVVARKIVSDGFDFAVGNGDVAGVGIGRGDHAPVDDHGIEAHCKRPPKKSRTRILC